MNKIILELELPVDLSDKEQVTSFLIEQTKFLVKTWKDILSGYRENGVTVPQIAARGVTEKKEVNNDLKEFRKTLLDHVLKYQPKVVIPPQIQAITSLYGLGRPAEEWIEMFEESRADWSLTTWLTVRSKLTKAESANAYSKAEEVRMPQAHFNRKELNDDEIKELRERMRGYSQDTT